MKIAKYIFLLILLMLLSGCKSYYEVDIGTDITEKITFKENRAYIESFSNVDSYINDTMSFVKNDDDLSNYKFYNIKNSVDDNVVSVLTRKFNSYNLYKNNSLFYNKIFYDSKKETINNEISYIFYLNDLSEYFSSTTLNTPFIDELEIRFCVNGKLISGNYSSLSNNCAIWNLPNEDYKNIIFSYEKVFSFSEIGIIVIILCIVILLLYIIYICYKFNRNKSY